MGHSAAALRDGTDRVLLLGGLRSQGTAEIVPGKDSQNVGEDKRYSSTHVSLQMDPRSPFSILSSNLVQSIWWVSLL